MKVTTRNILPHLNHIFPGVWLYGTTLKMIDDLDLSLRVRSQQEQVIFGHLLEVTRRQFAERGLNFSLGQEEAQAFLKAVGINAIDHGMVHSYCVYARMVSFSDAELTTHFHELIEKILNA